MAKVINDAGALIDFDAAVNLMDADIARELHDSMAPCTEQDYFTAYESAHLAKYGAAWELSKRNPTW